MPRRVSAVAAPRDARLVGLAFWAVMLGSMVLSAFVAERSAAHEGLQIVCGLATNFLAYVWVILDSRARGYVPSHTLKLGVILFSPIAIPIYLARTRSLGMTAKIIGLFLLKFVGLLIVAMLLIAGLAAAGLAHIGV